MNITLFIIVSTLLAIAYLILGWYSSKKIRSTSDYFLAGRDLGLGAVTFTLIATQIGGGMLLGTSQEAYQYGLYGILYTAGMAIGFLLLASGIASRMQALNVATTAELFETKYQSRTLKKIASILSIITLWGILVGQIVGSKTLLAGMGIGSEIPFILFWVFIIVYTMMGGLYAVVLTDSIQVLLIVGIFLGIFIYTLLGEPASFFTLGGIRVLQSQFTTTNIGLSEFTVTLCMPIFFSLIEQDLAQRFFAARSKTIATFSAIISSVFLVAFSCVPIYLGMKAKTLGLSIPTGSSPLIPALEILTNDFILVLAICGIIAAITSTADSLLCAISSNIAQDFNFQLRSTNNPIVRSQVITLIVGSIALICSYFVPQNVISILIESYALSVSCLFVPLLFAYFKPAVKKQTAIAAVISGLISFIAIQFWQTTLPKSLLPILVSFIAYVMTHYIFQNK